MGEPKPKGPRGRPPRAPLEPLPLNEEDEAYCRAVHERMNGALSLEMVRATFRLSLGRPDAHGRVGGSREQIAATQLLLSALLPKPKPIDTEREERDFQVTLVNPYGESEAECPACGHKFNHTPTSGPDSTMDDK
ncbi:hypothetical protein [Anaeromyxobacter terrae]|uniref:hypothetical protein n=1 Tax=Anaeromyxobacter terrae TaxID=2925406 RepID=UPI001F578679|nr:hypothetical protein [Anaeromyxobacter sp. SG22]